MKVTTYALMAAAGLAAAATVPVTAQQSDPTHLRITIVTSHAKLWLNNGNLVILRTSFAKVPVHTHRDNTINRKPVKLEPVHVVASRDNSSQRSK